MFKKHIFFLNDDILKLFHLHPTAWADCQTSRWWYNLKDTLAKQNPEVKWEWFNNSSNCGVAQRDTYVWPDIDIELLLNITLEYKVNITLLLKVLLGRLSTFLVISAIYLLLLRI